MGLSKMWVLPLLFTFCVGLNPPHIERRINGYIAKYGLYTAPVGQSSEDHQIGDDGRCLMVTDPGFTPLPVVECCKKPYGELLHSEVDGYCRSSDCTVFGYPTKDGLSCDCLACDCVMCTWDNEDCFTSPDWHLDSSGNPSPVNGKTCFGKVTCKPNDAGQIPANCEDPRVGQYCLEITNASSPFLYGGQAGDRTPWMTTFKACGNYLCNNDTDCCGGQYCNVTGFDVNSCDKCNYTGICTDDNKTFIPDCLLCPPCTPCDDKYRSEECKKAVTDHPDWNYVDIPSCHYEDLEDIKKKYECERQSEDCDTWVCNIYIPSYEFSQLTNCDPEIIVVTETDPVP